MIEPSFVNAPSIAHLPVAYNTVLASVTDWGQGCFSLARGWLVQPLYLGVFTTLLTQDAGLGKSLRQDVQYG